MSLNIFPFQIVVSASNENSCIKQSKSNYSGKTCGSTYSHINNPHPQGTREVDKTSCDPCQAGKYQAAVGKDYCDTCTEGTISGTGASECTVCPQVVRVFSLASKFTCGSLINLLLCVESFDEIASFK